MSSHVQVNSALRLRRWHIADIGRAYRGKDDHEVDPEQVAWLARQVDDPNMRCLTRDGMLIGTVDMSGNVPLIWLAEGFDDPATRMEAEMLVFLETC